MRVIKPFDITDSTLTETNVPEDVVQTYAAGTTYAEGDRAGEAPVDGEAQTVYESLQDNNTGNALTDTDWWWPIGIVYPEYDSGVTYKTGDTVTVKDSDLHELYESKQNGNSGNATSDTDFWRFIGATNAWRMYSDVIQDQTVLSSVEGGIQVTVTPGEIVNALSLVNISAVDVDVVVTDPTDGEVYNENIQLLSDDGIDNWYDYFFAPIVRETKLSLFDLPAYTNAEIFVSINDDEEAKVGAMIVGNYMEIGDSQYGASFGIKDYSTKEVDDDGRATLNKRGFSDRQDVDVVIDTSRFGVTKRLLTELRSTPTVWVADPNQPETIVYGYYRDFDIIISGPSVSDCTLEIRGLL